MILDKLNEEPQFAEVAYDYLPPINFLSKELEIPPVQTIWKPAIYLASDEDYIYFYVYRENDTYEYRQLESFDTQGKYWRTSEEICTGDSPFQGYSPFESRQIRNKLNFRRVVYGRS